MVSPRGNISIQNVMVIAVILVVTLSSSILINEVSFGLAIVVILGLIVAIFTFLSPEFALYALLAAMLLGPQIGLEGAAGESVRGRGVTLRVDDFLLIIIGLTWFFKTAVEKDIGLFLHTPLNRPIALYFFICVTSTLLGYMMGRVKGTAGFFFVLKYFEYYIVYFMAVNHLREKAQIQRFLAFMLIVCFLVSLYAIAQIPQGIRASAPFEGEAGEPNTLGGYLVFMISIALGLFLTSVTQKHKAYLLIFLFFAAFALAGTLSRTSWIAIGPMALTLLMFSDKKLYVMAGIAVFILLSPFVFPQSVKERILFTIAQPKEEGQMRVGNVRVDTSTSARLESMKQVLTRDFAKQPVIGFGVTGYSFLDAQYARVLAETGLLGIFTFFYLISCIYRHARDTYEKTEDPLYRGLCLGYITGLAALLTHSIGANTFIIVRIMEPFWFITAMIIMIPRIEAGEFAKPTVATGPVGRRQPLLPPRAGTTTALGSR